ncbi:MAG: hypothetical protein ACP6IP_09610 [Candidatus Njordarchaeia archaeon]
MSALSNNSNGAINENLLAPTKERIKKELRGIFPPKTIINWEMKVHTFYGVYIQININAKASEAIRMWNKTIEKLKNIGLTKTIFLDWYGETDLDPATLGYEIGRILGKMKTKLATEKPIDFTEIINKLRD